MGQFAMRTSHEQLVETVFHKGHELKGLFSLSPAIHCGSLDIPGGPPVVHLDHVGNHCFSATCTK